MNEQQRRLLLFIRDRTRATGVAPTMHEMAAAIGNKHRSGAHRYLASLESQGWIRRTPRQKQSIEVLRIPDGIEPTEISREEILLRLAAELAHRNIAVREGQSTTTVSASWILEAVEAAGFRLIRPLSR